MYLGFNLGVTNLSIDQSEIKNLQTHQAAIEEALAETRFRLDSLHLVVCENWGFILKAFVCLSFSCGV